jgi:hypothetical protein
MAAPTNSPISLVIAIGIGLLIGAERELRKGIGSRRGAAGVRTFALAAFAGGLSSYLKSEALLVAVAAAAVLFSSLAYRGTAREDPGLTTEFALLVTVLLGALTMQNPPLATGLSVVTTILLAAREHLQRALKNLLSGQEAHDALVFLAATLVILPLAPNRELGPLGAFNFRKIWELVVLVMSVGGASYIGLRAFGSRLGLVLAGFVGGFISASATIGSMGNRAKRNPEIDRRCFRRDSCNSSNGDSDVPRSPRHQWSDMSCGRDAIAFRRSCRHRIRTDFCRPLLKDSDGQ